MKAYLLARPWLLPLLILAAVALFSGASALFTTCGTRRAAKAVHTARTQHTATVAADTRPAQAFDSTFNTLAGQRRENSRHLKASQHFYDSLHRRLPTHLPVFPALPPRYGPTH